MYERYTKMLILNEKKCSLIRLILAEYCRIYVEIIVNNNCDMVVKN